MVEIAPDGKLASEGEISYIYDDLNSDLIAELVDESFHKVTEITNYRGRAGAQFMRGQVATSLRNVT